MCEKFFCLADIEYLEEETYVPRHQKAILLTESFKDAYEQIECQLGESIERLTLSWAGKPKQSCKQDLFFSESEFDRFELVKTFIEDDHSYEDYKTAEEEFNERRRQNT